MYKKIWSGKRAFSQTSMLVFGFEIIRSGIKGDRRR